MKKRSLGALIVLISFLLTFGFSSSISAEDSNLIHGVVPTKVTEHSSYTDKFGKFESNMEFWNVGKLGGEQYANVTMNEVLIEKAEGIQGPENGYTWKYDGTFTGGPNGDFNLSITDGGVTYKVHFKLQDGREIISDDGTTTPFDYPEVFKGWYDEEPFTVPTIELSISEPAALEAGKLRWTVEAIVSGNPAPTVEFSGDPSDSISATETENVVTITVEEGKIFELTATADNWMGSKTVLMSFVNEDSGARFSDIAGQVEIRPHNDEEAWSSAKLNSKLYVDMHVKTFENSTAILSFADMSTFILKPNSEVILSSASAKESTLKLLWGNMMLNVKKMMKDGSMQVEMSQAVAGIKGTRLILSETGSESTIKVTEGTVQFTLNNSSQLVEVSQGESVTASQNGLSEKTTFDPIEEEKSWEAIGSPTPSPSSPPISTSAPVQPSSELPTGASPSATAPPTPEPTGSGTFLGLSTQWWIVIGAGLGLLLLAILVLVLIVRSGRQRRRVPSAYSVPPIPGPAAIHCGACGTTLPPGQRFCGSCGADSLMAAAPPVVPAVVPLGNVCPTCGHPVIPADRFCQGCGGTLPGGAA